MPSRAAIVTPAPSRQGCSTARFPRRRRSCIYRTGERFGQAYVVDVLLGADNERIAQFGHDRISTFGIGKEHDNRTWRAILRQLITLRLVDVDLAGHGGLSIAP